MQILSLFHVIGALGALACLGAEPAAPDSAAVPAEVDLRPQFERFGLAERRQLSRPTCSAFTVTGPLEFAVASRQGHSPRLSVEFLNWAANQTGGDTADGGFFSDLWQGFAAHGICTEEDLPYQAQFEAGRPPGATALADARTRLGLGLGLRFNWIKEWDVNSGLTDAHLAGIKRTLAQGWPVCGGFRWPKEAKWEHDVLQMCPTNAVYDGHSVLLVGYREDAAQPGGGVFQFRNTSGDGRNGTMSYAYARAFMNDAAWVDHERRPKPPETASPAPSVFRDPLSALAAPPVGRNRRVSSNQLPKWNDANLDMTLLPPGKSLGLPLLEGPGMITHIWFTSHAGRVNELNALSLRVYWDGREQPGVEVPVGDLFAVGQGPLASVESVPVQVSPSGALSCF